jgi:hypothetical protein
VKAGDAAPSELRAALEANDHTAASRAVLCQAIETHDALCLFVNVC